MSGISFLQAKIFIGIILCLTLSAGLSHAQEKNKFYNPDGDDENIVYEKSAAGEKS